MKEFRLIPMTDFVLEQQDKIKSDRFYQGQFKDNVVAYAKFLKQPLTLGMFVPCDNERDVLQEPYNDGMNDMYFQSALEEYQKAKEKVLFKNVELLDHLENAYIFKIGEWEFSLSNTEPNAMILTKRRTICTIEQLANYISDFDIEIELTESAIKQLGL